MVDEAVNSAFGELFAALFAGVLVSVGRIFKLWTAVEILKYDGVGLATHDQSLSRALRRDGALDLDSDFSKNMAGRDGAVTGGQLGRG